MTEYVECHYCGQDVKESEAAECRPDSDGRCVLCGHEIEQREGEEHER